MILKNPGRVALLFMEYGKCLEKNYVPCDIELSGKDEYLIVRPWNSREDYLRFFINDDAEVSASIYIGCDRMATVDPDDFRCNLDDMLSHGRVIWECELALDYLLDRIDAACRSIHARYIDIPSGQCLGMAFNKFLVHSCEGMWDDEVAGKIYFNIKGEELPNGCGYCLDYHDMHMYVVSGDLKVIASRDAVVLSMSYINDKTGMDE